jgi:hypothetical protein
MPRTYAHKKHRWAVPRIRESPALKCPRAFLFNEHSRFLQRTSLERGSPASLTKSAPGSVLPVSCGAARSPGTPETASHGSEYRTPVSHASSKGFASTPPRYMHSQSKPVSCQNSCGALQRRGGVLRRVVLQPVVLRCNRLRSRAGYAAATPRSGLHTLLGCVARCCAAPLDALRWCRVHGHVALSCNTSSSSATGHAALERPRHSKGSYESEVLEGYGPVDRGIAALRRRRNQPSPVLIASE